MADYVIAVKRGYRGEVPDDWQEALSRMDGVDVVGRQPIRMQIRASPQTMSRVRALLGTRYHVEEAIPHRTAGLPG